MLMLAAAARSTGGAPAVDARQTGQPVRFKRPDALTIRETTRGILADPRFAPRKTFMQWLFEKLSSWRVPRPDMDEGWVRVLLWIIVAWCVVALVAILGHLVWTLATLWRSRVPRSGLHTQRFRPDAGRSLSSVDLRSEMLRLAQRGAFREAIGLMTVGLLRRLDDAGVLRFHESKTNGDYVFEYPWQRPGRDDFRRFVLSVDGVIYGGAPCGEETYGQLLTLQEEIVGHARRRS